MQRFSILTESYSQIMVDPRGVIATLAKLSVLSPRRLLSYFAKGKAAWRYLFAHSPKLTPMMNTGTILPLINIATQPRLALESLASDVGNTLKHTMTRKQILSYHAHGCLVKFRIGDSRRRY